MTSSLKISFGQYSDKGIKQENEDFYGVAVPEEPQLTHKGIAIAIADGMSGSDAGKEASHACVIGVLADYYSTPDSWTVTTAVQKILSATNNWLYANGHSQYQSTKGMVSTLSVLIFKSNTGHIFHIGDSRISRLRGGDFEQLTRDHRVYVSEEKSYLNRAMGIDPHLDVDYKTFPLQVGDLFVLTSDGVHEFISEKVLKKKIIESSDNLDAVAKIICDEAAANHSDDNLTCQIVRIDGLPVQREDELRRQHANLPFPPPLESGMILDGFKVEKELHSSKRTQIYKAFDTLNKRTIILKTPSLNFEDDPHYIEHFLHEEWAGRRLKHKNVLKVLECDRQKKSIYYVTEYIEGPTLREWMTQNPRPDPKKVVDIIEHINRGIRALHHMEMLHQDLKPENIMFDGSGNIKIIDFGSVKIAGIAEIAPFKEKEDIMGTLNYTAPEYLLGQRGDIRSDLFSLAVIAYEMLNGALPFGKEMPLKADKLKVSRLEYVPSIGLNPMVPNWMDGALKKALAINPNQRYDELSEFIYDLQHPNSRFMTESRAAVPLMQRNPLRFWQSVCAILLFTNFVLIYLLTLI